MKNNSLSPNNDIKNKKNSYHAKSSHTRIPLDIDSAINNNGPERTDSNCCLWFCCWCMSICDSLIEKATEKRRQKRLDKDLIKIDKELDAFNPVIFYSAECDHIENSENLEDSLSYDHKDTSRYNSQKAVSL